MQKRRFLFMQCAILATAASNRANHVRLSERLLVRVVYFFAGASHHFRERAKFDGIT